MPWAAASTDAPRASTWHASLFGVVSAPKRCAAAYGMHRLAHACTINTHAPKHASVCTKHLAVRVSTSTRPSMSPMPRRRWMNGRVANGSNASKCSPVPARADFSNVARPRASSAGRTQECPSRSTLAFHGADTRTRQWRYVHHPAGSLARSGQRHEARSARLARSGQRHEARSARHFRHGCCA